MTYTDWPFILSSVFLRPLDASDVNTSYLNWFSDPVVCRYIDYANSAPAIDDLKLYVEERTNLSTCLFLGIFDNTSGTLIGTLKFEPINFTLNTAELGILIGSPDYRGKGIAKQALSGAFALLKSQYGISQVTLGVKSDNNSALGLYKSLGFNIISSSTDSLRMMASI